MKRNLAPALALAVVVTLPLAARADNSITFSSGYPSSPQTGTVEAAGQVNLDAGWSVVGGNIEVIAAKVGGGTPGGDITGPLSMTNTFDTAVTGLTSGASYLVVVRVQVTNGTSTVYLSSDEITVSVQ
jgi:hypothetical protein